MDIRVSWGHMEPTFWEEEEVVGGQRWRHLKERWWFPIGSPLQGRIQKVQLRGATRRHENRGAEGAERVGGPLPGKFRDIFT